MPLFNGIETATKLREMQQLGEISLDIKLVMFSGNDLFHYTDYDRRHLFNHYMSKPLDKKHLMKICKQLKLI
jgi:YesN/AraC family two-component response regulator